MQHWAGLDIRGGYYRGIESTLLKAVRVIQGHSDGSIASFDAGVVNDFITDERPEGAMKPRVAGTGPLCLYLRKVSALRESAMKSCGNQMESVMKMHGNRCEQ